MENTGSPKELRVIVIPDSFKGSLTAKEAATAMGKGVLSAAQHVGIPVELVKIPFADGGEGTLDAVSEPSALEGRTSGTYEIRWCETTDALGRPKQACFGISSDGKSALIEAAQANGVVAVSDVPPEPLSASTFGVGTLALAALDAGVTRIIITLGGSATTDGGLGFFQAIGGQVSDAERDETISLDLSHIDPRVNQVEWLICSDVNNPLTGPRGAARIFGPQKGANAEEVLLLECRLERLSRGIRAANGRDAEGIAGLGGGGGLAAIPYAFFGAKVVSGWRTVAHLTGATKELANADLVLTAEGFFDSQSLDGKVVSGVREMTPVDIPVVVIAGQVVISQEDLVLANITAAFSISHRAATVTDLISDAAALLEETTFNTVSLWLSGHRDPKP